MILFKTWWFWNWAMLVGLFIASGLVMNLPKILLVFAILSLGSRLFLRKGFRAKHGSVKTFDHDINDEMR